MGGEQKKDSSTSGSAIRTKTKEIKCNQPAKFNSHAPPEESRKMYADSKVDLYLSIKGKKLPDLSQLVLHNLKTFKRVRYVIVGALQKYNLAALSEEPDDMVSHEKAAIKEEEQFFINNRTNFVRPIVCELGIAFNIPIVNHLSDDNDKHEAIKQNMDTALAQIETQFNFPPYDTVLEQIKFINQYAQGRFEITLWNTFLEQVCIGKESERSESKNPEIEELESGNTKARSLENMALEILEICEGNPEFEGFFVDLRSNPAKRYLDSVTSGMYKDARNVSKEAKKKVDVIAERLKDPKKPNMQCANKFVKFEAAVFASIVFLKEKPDYHAYAGTLSDPIIAAFKIVKEEYKKDSVPFIQIDNVPAAPKKLVSASTDISPEDESVDRDDREKMINEYSMAIQLMVQHGLMFGLTPYEIGCMVRGFSSKDNDTCKFNPLAGRTGSVPVLVGSSSSEEDLARSPDSSSSPVQVTNGPYLFRREQNTFSSQESTPYSPTNSF